MIDSYCQFMDKATLLLVEVMIMMVNHVFKVVFKLQ